MQPRPLGIDPTGLFVHGIVLDACHRFGRKTALVDASFEPPRRISFADYGELIERLARGLVGAGVRPGDRIALYLPNWWEFCVTYHAATLAGAVPTPLNPAYREREVRYQLENAGAVALVSDGTLLRGKNLSGFGKLRRVFTARDHTGVGSEPMDTLLQPTTATLPELNAPPEETLAALPYSSGTTGLPKGVKLSHGNVVTNVYQSIPPGEAATGRTEDVVLCFLPLYHIYGLNVVMTPALAAGVTLVLVARFDTAQVLDLTVREGVTIIPLVPPVINAFCQAAEEGCFPRQHCVRLLTSGAAPLGAELPRRFSSLTGIPVRQGYGMTEASPVTHLGYIEPALYRPDSIGHAVALTDCRLVDESGQEVAEGELGELVMRGPQFMLGYWEAPAATAEVLREGWYWSGDMARRDAKGLYFIVDRRKEMIKYKGFPVAPAEVEAVLLRHPAVRDCGVVGQPDDCAGEIPCAFIVLRDGYEPSQALSGELCGYVGEQLASYKQPRAVQFVAAIPRNPSGKILRRELRALL